MNMPIISNNQALIIPNPGKCSFYFPQVSHFLANSFRLVAVLDDEPLFTTEGKAEVAASTTAFRLPSEILTPHCW